MPRDSVEGKVFEEKKCIAENSLSGAVNELEDAVSLRSTKFSSDQSKGRAESHELRKSNKIKTSPKRRSTIPHPFSFSTEKRASSHVSPCSKLAIPSPSKPISLPRKTIKDVEEDDDCSLGSSSAVSTQPVKPVTVGIAPTFKSAERLDKRKEFYTKLEEKHRALAVEKSQEEARTKEEQEAAIKQMRKNMIVKSNPVPRFYYEPPPPNPELKKPPLTRPTSPKFNIRRKSCSDAVHAGVRENTKQRHSVGNATKSKAVQRKGNGTREIKDRAKELVSKDTIAHEDSSCAGGGDASA